ncbi:uncharacterized protein ACLA_083740 [Aspergillus clavatus NRRL 1]|uniref:Conserved glutamic acid-rich protein n=1 Tax=Aspergillus clavatus (strain ATCC 1007 / CBS 513.65 / DSM 816 / NCTC 3887 / NRRL 1 / QM 1276 / 107) TaxID=344612 RepID=A1CTP2_ASPCL|nr:conserved glutamic acid-rich protein [Aspergillus clavatus NRRL 1]EAW06679.1 conserved glutamic acid-rich protein [Aspergillus clavatus NRRL 1]
MSSARKNKRNSTIQSVDHINSLMDTSRSKPRIRRLPSQPINRFRSRTPQVLRSDGLQEIPSSSPAKTRPSSRRVPQTDIISPRRSGRIRKHFQAEWTPSRRSRRLAHVREEGEVQRGQHEDRDDDDDDDDSGDEEELDEGIDKHLSRRLIETRVADMTEVDRPGESDEERSSQTGDIPFRLPSPPNINDEASLMNEEQDRRLDKPEVIINTRASEELEDSHGPESITAVETTREVESPRWNITAPGTRRHTLAAQGVNQDYWTLRTKRQTRSSPFEQAIRSTDRKSSNTESEYRATGSDNSSESEYLVEEEAESDAYSEVQSELGSEQDSIPESVPATVPQAETEPNSLRPTRPVEKELAAKTSASKRYHTSEYEQISQERVVRRRSTPISVHSDPSVSDREQERRTRRRSKDRAPIELINTATNEREAGDNVSSVEENAGDKSWFVEASNLGDQKDNWDTLVAEAKKLKEHDQLPCAEEFLEMKKYLSQLRTRYTKIIKELKSQRGPLRENLRECEGLRDAISKEGLKLLDNVYYLAIRRKESYQLLKKSEELVEGFEVHVLPALIKMILLCFEAYYTNRKLFPSSLRHLVGAMKLLLQFCDRVVSLRDERYVTCEIRSRTIRKALMRLMEALDADLLQPRRDDGHPAAVSPRRNWSEDEKAALIDGLKLYQGEDRYMRLVCHFGQQLRHRTLQELQIKAREIHDRLIPRIQEDLLTVEGRRLWQWLLSVR